MQALNKYKKYLILFSALGLLIFFVILYFNEQDYSDSINVDADEEISLISNVTTKVKGSFYVDVKGAVKKPGVYMFNDEDKVIDAINAAGGLTKNAVTTNINLSQKLTSEMVVYIFTKSELTTKNSSSVACKCETIEVNNCINKEENTTKISTEYNSATESNKKVNINTASLEELITLSGIGESKAKAIITYRSENGNFNTIEDIKNVSGLGDSLFDKIKDYITV